MGVGQKVGHSVQVDKINGDTESIKDSRVE